ICNDVNTRQITASELYSTRIQGWECGDARSGAETSSLSELTPAASGVRSIPHNEQRIEGIDVSRKEAELSVPPPFPPPPVSPRNASIVSVGSERQLT